MRDSAEHPVSELLTPEARTTLDGSGYGSWRRLATADAVSLAFGFPYPDSFRLDRLRESIETVLASEGRQALQYGGGEYADLLESAVRNRATARGIDPDETAVLLTNGATHAVDSVCRAFLEPGDVVAVERPTFMGSLTVFRNFGVEIEELPVDDAGLDVDALADRLHARRAAGDPIPKLLYTITDFQNPTGTTLSRKGRERLLALADEFDFAVVEDGAYTDLRYEGETVPPLAALDDAGRVIRVESFAKTIAPGVRLGWLVAAEPIRDAIDALAAGGANTFTRSVIGHYCDAGHLEASLPPLREAYAARRDRLLDALERHMPASATWTDPDGGFFVWVELDESVDTDDRLDDAIDAGVTYLPGSMFYADPDAGSNALRLSFSYADPDAFDDAIAALATVVD
ncbi:PLP-dependent aminotransferase family protein [Halovivax cerinus]|uniref:PLP-dependent aminotransferase family protein n=1 Tax=Halovivax cerinus TaxID=1487865 RepID=A0ABD5NNE6_9EURY|nr:PLP-dependent aminotransferase family protein [Halovivax cerinus]